MAVMGGDTTKCLCVEGVSSRRLRADEYIKNFKKSFLDPKHFKKRGYSLRRGGGSTFSRNYGMVLQAPPKIRNQLKINTSQKRHKFTKILKS